MTESMIERVAKAMFNAHTLSGEDHWAFADDIQRESKLREARAAIEAMAEPTKIQLEAMEPWSRVSGHHEMVWKAGVKAALIYPAGSADRAGVPLARD